VRVIFVVAVIACGMRVAIFGVLFMTCGASQPYVRAFQGEVGLTVIEGIGIKMDDIGAAANMIRMADFAGELLDVVDAPMKSQLSVDILRDLFMAI